MRVSIKKRDIGILFLVNAVILFVTAFIGRKPLYNFFISYLPFHFGYYGYSLFESLSPVLSCFIGAVSLFFAYKIAIKNDMEKLKLPLNIFLVVAMLLEIIFAFCSFIYVNFCSVSFTDIIYNIVLSILLALIFCIIFLSINKIFEAENKNYVCPVCKHYVKYGVLFCKHCGSKMKWK